MSRITKIQLRRGTAAAWVTANPILASGEMGVETDTDLFKFGDGTSVWTNLDYTSSGSSFADLSTKNNIIFEHTDLQPFKYAARAKSLPDGRIFIALTMNDSSGETAASEIFGAYCAEGNDPALAASWTEPYLIISHEGDEQSNGAADFFIRDDGNIVLVIGRIPANQDINEWRYMVGTAVPAGNHTWGASIQMPAISGIQYFTGAPSCGCVLDDGTWIFSFGQSLQGPPGQGSQTGLYVLRIIYSTNQGTSWTVGPTAYACNDGIGSESNIFQLPNFNGVRGAIIISYRTRLDICGFLKIPDPADLTTYSAITSTLPTGNQPSSIAYYPVYKTAIAIVNGPVQTEVRKTLEIWVSSDNRTSSDSDNIFSWDFRALVHQDFTMEHIDVTSQFELNGRLYILFFTRTNAGLVDTRIFSIPMGNVLGGDHTHMKYLNLKSNLLNNYGRILSEDTDYTHGQQRLTVIDGPNSADPLHVETFENAGGAGTWVRLKSMRILSGQERFGFLQSGLFFPYLPVPEFANDSAADDYYNTVGDGGGGAKKGRQYFVTGTATLKIKTTAGVSGAGWSTFTLS